MYDGIFFGRSRRVPGFTGRGHRNVDGDLFAGLDGDIEYLAVFQHHTPTLVDGKDRGNLVPILWNHHLEAGVAELLFIGRCEEYHVPVDVNIAALERDERREISSHHAFVVNRSAAPQVAVLDNAAERVGGPLALVHTDHVHVGHEQERFRRVRQTPDWAR